MIRSAHFRLSSILFLVVLALCVSGCPNHSGEIITASSSARTIFDKGDFTLQYEPRHTRTKRGNNRRVGENVQAISAVIADLNSKASLPFDLIVSWPDCDEPDAYYDSDTHHLVLCQQLIDEYYDLFAPKIKDKAKLDDAVRGAIAATFLHELGHALIDAWKLPITGKEEDAADQLSTLMLINRTESGEQMALDSALSFKLSADSSKDEKRIYWDEHSFDEQRYYDTICMIYGHNPQKYDYLIANGTLPEERSENCQDDFNRIDRSWKMLLAPHLK